ncbi:MAG: tetratricopeptide repeat protein [Ignavibacteriales bacterium]|nr:tetratricopeptide repeat protein [Ignavibacteriales bacterium]
MKKIFVLVISLLSPLLAQTDELTSVFDEANKLYMEQKFAAAITKYESIIKNGYENAEVYFNLGNAYYKSGKIQNAILNYERAKKFMPNDDDVQFNLALANAHLIDKVEAIPELFVYEWADYFLTIISLETMMTMMYFLFILTLVSFSLFLFALTIQSYRESNTEFAIVMTDVANIKSAPDRSGNDLFVIHRGLKVQVLDSVNRWRKIRLVDGKIGWIPEQEVETI